MWRNQSGPIPVQTQSKPSPNPAQTQSNPSPNPAFSFSGLTAGTAHLSSRLSQLKLTLHGFCLRTVSESDWDLKTRQMITFLLCLFIFLSASLSSVSLPSPLFNLSLYSGYYFLFIAFSPPLRSLSLWPRAVIEGITADCCSADVRCRRAESSAADQLGWTTSVKSSSHRRAAEQVWLAAAVTCF